MEKEDEERQLIHGRKRWLSAQSGCRQTVIALNLISGKKFFIDECFRDALYPEADKHFAKLIWGASGKYEAGF